MRAHQTRASDPAQGSFAEFLFSPVPEAHSETPTLAPDIAVPTETAESVAHPLDALTVPVYRVQLVREGEQPLPERRQIQKPQDAAQLFSAFLQDKDREHFVVLMLDTKNRVIGLNVVSIGILDSALVTPREVFKPAILANAACVILCHNHPSGDPAPSPEDRQITRRLYDAGQLLHIEVLDHLIVGENGAFQSLKELGVL